MSLGSSSVFILHEEMSPERQEDPTLEPYADTQILEETQEVEVVDESPPPQTTAALETQIGDAMDAENKENIENGVEVQPVEEPKPPGKIPKAKPKASKSRRMVIDDLTQDETQPPEESPAPETQPADPGY